MYKLVHTHTKTYLSQNKHALSWTIHTIQVSAQCKACPNQERDIIIHVILKKIKNRHKIKYFCLFWKFSMFLDFFLLKKKEKKNSLKNKTLKIETKHVHN